MIHAVLLILKIIGIIILVLLGLLLLLLAIILFVPVRYRITLEHGDGFHLEGRVGWLLHILHARISQINDKRLIRIRIFGIILYDSLCPEKGIKLKGKKQNSQKKKSKAKKKHPDSDNKTDALNDETSKSAVEKLPKDGLTTDRISCESDNGLEIEHTGETLSGSIDSSKAEQAIDEDMEQEEIKDAEQPQPKFGKTIHKVKSFFRGVVSFFIRLKDKIREKIKSFANLKQKFRLVIDFIKNEANQEGFKLSLESLVKLCKHVFPTKLKSQLVFGTGDPCSTGQALGAFSILYSFYGDNIQITPDFENKVFKGKHYARGRIRLITILIIVIKLIMDKRFKKLQSNYKILKEAL